MAMTSSLKRKLSARQHNDILQHVSQMAVRITQDLKLHAIQVDCNELQTVSPLRHCFLKEVKDLLTSLGLNARFAILILASVGWMLT